jgi:hypothetical protein
MRFGSDADGLGFFVLANSNGLFLGGNYQNAGKKKMVRQNYRWADPNRFFLDFSSG